MGELTELDRDEYEEHFFSCPACAEEIKSAEDFMESARKVVRAQFNAQTYGDGFRRSVWGKWLNWRTMLQPIPAMACALLVAVSTFAVYQNRVVIPSLAKNTASPAVTAQLVASREFMIAESRGEANSASVRRDQAFILRFDIVDTGFSLYRAEIRDQSDVTKLSLNVPEKDTGSSIKFLVSAGALESGRYSLVINGVNSSLTQNALKGEPTRIPFLLTIQD